MDTKASAGKRPSVLILIENLPAPFDRRVWQEASTLRDDGWDVSIICPKMKGYEKSFEIIDSIYIYRHPIPFEASGFLGFIAEYGTALFFEFLLAFRVLFTRGFDVVHACNPPDLLFLVGGFFKFCLGKKFVFDHHDLNPELYEAKFGRRGFLWQALLFFEKCTFRTADLSIATNESYRRVAIERGGMDPSQVHVVRSGPSLERMRQLPAVPKHRHGREHLVGYVGVMGRQEGIQYLLAAAQHIVQSVGREDIHFGLVGGGPELEELKTLATRLGVADFVTFTGRVPDQDLLEVLNTASVCVNPDEFNEMNDKSTMNKIMEYMALGKPIVQFDLTEGRVSAENASLYAERNNAIDLAEKILWVLEHPEEAKEMGQVGFARVRDQLAWEYEIPKLTSAYRSLIAPK